MKVLKIIIGASLSIGILAAALIMIVYALVTLDNKYHYVRAYMDAHPKVVVKEVTVVWEPD